jgi:hypothetical protein
LQLISSRDRNFLPCHSLRNRVKEWERIEGHLSELERNEVYYRKKEGTIKRKKMVMAKESEKEIEGKVGVTMEEVMILDWTLARC